MLRESSTPMTTMRALIPTGNLAEMVRLSDVTEPEPAASEVVVAVDAFSINRGETFLLERPPADRRPGKDCRRTSCASSADSSGHQSPRALSGIRRRAGGRSSSWFQ